MRQTRSKSPRCTIRLVSAVCCALTAAASGGEKVFLEETGHYYERVDSPIGLTWVEAVDEAALRSHLGLPGHLATLSSALENDLITSRVLKGRAAPTFRAWIGAFQPVGSLEPESDWRWITGEDLAFSDWEPGEPDDASGDDNAISIQNSSVVDQGTWSDLNSGELLTSYIVEYGDAAAEARPDDKPAWRSSALDLPRPGGHTQAASDPLGRVYLPLGRDPVLQTPRQDVVRFDEATRSWQFVAALGEARADAAVAVDQLGRIYCIGGEGEREVLASVERYDPESDSWTFVAPLPEPRWAGRAVADASGEWIYVLGGRVGGRDASPSRSVTRYSIENDLWVTVPPMSVPRIWFGAARGADGHIYAVGGATELDEETDSTVERFDPERERWSSVAPLVAHAGEVGAAVVDSCGFIYAIGGFDTGFSAAVERYVPSRGAWELCPSLGQAKRRLAAALAPSGRIYAFGGEAQPGLPPPRVEFTFSCGAPDVARVWKVSVKFILDGAGRRPASGSLTTDDDVRAQISLANSILCSAGSAWTLHLTEVTAVRNASRWVTLSCPDEPVALETVALENQGRFQWRPHTINVYIVAELEGCGGVCSFPESGSSIIVLGQRTTPTTLLHEVGHYFGLCHTHGCACGPCENGGAGPCHTETVDDLVDDTLPDIACWTRQDIAFDSFGTDYESLTAQESAEVDGTFFNVMSYHPVDPVRTRLTAGQIERMTAGAALRPSSIVGFLDEDPCAAEDFGDRTAVGSYFLRADSNSDGKLNLGDPIHTLGLLFGGGGEPLCADAADADDSGVLNLADPIFTLTRLFSGGNAVPSPGIDACGQDPTPDELPSCAYDTERCPEVAGD